MKKLTPKQDRTMKQAIRVAAKKLSFKSERRLEESLDFTAESMAEAYRIGAQEAQGEILRRLHKLQEQKSARLHQGRSTAG